MAITKATNLASVGSGLGTNPSQPINVGLAVTIDGNSGIITATTFHGNLIGSASTTSFATTSATAQGLIGVPNITVGTIIADNATFTDNVRVLGAGIIVGTAVTAVDGNFTGNVSIAGTLTYEDVTNIDSIGLITARNGLQVLSGITTISGQTNLSNTTISGVTTITNVVIPNEIRFSNVAEKIVRVSASSSIGVCTYSSDTGNIIYFDAPSDDVVIRVEGIPETSAFDNHSITVSAILRTTGTGRSCHPFVRLNGVERPVKFAGGSRNEATTGVTTTNGYTTYSFVGINTIGSASTTANYEVFGIVSGGFF
jgi:hypothetical protein